MLATKASRLHGIGYSAVHPRNCVTPLHFAALFVICIPRRMATCPVRTTSSNPKGQQHFEQPVRLFLRFP